ncbi:hypothetical protein FPCIR_13857 [Fusarium pseudocircinatum]|uniref:F-box domain-containing protein n=1 Tax=Fusarium pseudocircinatum TaxID=56676 RepID=A0A8H5KI57_9HYPO|nr:hypothetical protein FPCIR_13857 [Fusarium pseudocircinatum]
MAISSRKTSKTNENAHSTIFSLDKVPQEIIQLIAENIEDRRSMVKMACTSKRYYSIVSPILHKLIFISANHWSHTHNVISRLVLYLSVTRKKDITEETPYKNQQEKFPNSHDLEALPPCANNVRQMIVGTINPGLERRGIIMRYLEEVMKNLHNLKVFKGHDLTESMSKSIAAQQNLEALYISFSNMKRFENNVLSPFTKIRNLQHLHVTGSHSFNGEKVLSSMLLNSLTTLESLEIAASWDWSGFMDNWEENIKALSPKTWEQIPHFTSLKSLSLSFIIFNRKLRQNLVLAVDFLKLEELQINDFGDYHKDIIKEHLDGPLEFFQSLERLFKKTKKGDIHLRHLSLQISGFHRKQRHEIEEDLRGIYGFISSFDTLTRLEIHHYNTYVSNRESNPGLLLQLLLLIREHKGLETLRFHYKDVMSGHEIPCFTAASVKILVDNLPKLRVLEFPPSGDDKDEMLQALSRAKNLTTLIFNDEQALYPRSDFPEDYHAMVVKSVIEGFMKHASCREFSWEKHYKLRELRIGSDAYAIASNLKHRKGRFKILPIKVAKGDREVMFQDLRRGKQPSQDRSYYVPEEEWMKKVTKPSRRAQFC